MEQSLTKNVNKLKIRSVLECHRFSGKIAILRQSIQYIRQFADFYLLLLDFNDSAIRNESRILFILDPLIVCFPRIKVD